MLDQVSLSWGLSVQVLSTLFILLTTGLRVFPLIVVIAAHIPQIVQSAILLTLTEMKDLRLEVHIGRMVLRWQGVPITSPSVLFALAGRRGLNYDLVKHVAVAVEHVLFIVVGLLQDAMAVDLLKKHLLCIMKVLKHRIDMQRCLRLLLLLLLAAVRRFAE